MEDQGKRLLIAVALCAVIMLAATMLFGPKKKSSPPPKKEIVEETTSGKETEKEKEKGPATPATAGAATEKPVVVDCTLEDNPPMWETDEWVATFSRCGGALKSFRLLGSQYWEKDPEGKHVPLD